MYAEITPLTMPITKVKISNSQNVTSSITLLSEQGYLSDQQNITVLT